MQRDPLTTPMSYHGYNGRPPKATAEEIKEFFHLLKQEKPDLTVREMKAMISAATRYAKDLLKGKAAELYGMSLDWAIAALKDEAMPLAIKRDIVIKVLGHCMPQEIVIGGSEESKPIQFVMARPKSDAIEGELIEPEEQVEDFTVRLTQALAKED